MAVAVCSQAVYHLLSCFHLSAEAYTVASSQTSYTGSEPQSRASLDEVRATEGLKLSKYLFNAASNASSDSQHEKVQSPVR